MSDCSTHKDEYPGVKRIIVHFTDPDEHDFEWPFVPLEREIAYIMVDGEKWSRRNEDGVMPATEKYMTKIGWKRERTCKQEERGWGTEGDHARVWLTCGHDCMVPTVQDLPNYCPNCGARVVS